MRGASVGRFTLGLVLTSLGIALFLDLNYGWDVLGTIVRFWPAVLILLGIEYLVVSRDPERRPRIGVGSVIAIAIIMSVAWAFSVGGQILSLGPFGVSYPGQATYTVRLPVDLSLDADTKEISLEAIGHVTLSGTEGSSVLGTASVTVRAPTTGEAKRVAEKLVVSAGRTGGVLRVEITPPEDAGRLVAVHPSFELSVPSGLDLSPETVSGDITVSRVTGRVNAHTVSGDVRIDAKPSSIAVETVSGDVEVTLSEEMENVSIKTVSGDAEIRALSDTGGTLSFSAVSGDVDTSLSGIETTRSPGSHKASGRFGTGETNILVTTVSGDLTIR